MKGFFDYDGFLSRVLTKLMYIVSVNLLFLICSIPIFTIGASATAMYTVLFRWVQGDEPDIIRTFFQGFKENFKKSTIIWLVMLAVGITLALNYYTMYHIGTPLAGLVQIILNMVLILWLAFWIYAFPSISFFKNSLSGYLRFTAGITIAQLPQTVSLFAVHMISLLVILFIAQYSQIGVILLACCGFSLSAYIASKILSKIFEKYGEPSV